jgi:hypothetical protein
MTSTWATFPLPGGPGATTRSEVLGQQAAAQTLVEGGNFRQAVAAADPFLNACDTRDAVRLTAFQLGIGLPDTGGAALGLIAAALLLGTGFLAAGRARVDFVTATFREHPSTHMGE